MSFDPQGGPAEESASTDRLPTFFSQPQWPASAPLQGVSGQFVLQPGGGLQQVMAPVGGQGLQLHMAGMTGQGWGGTALGTQGLAGLSNMTLLQGPQGQQQQVLIQQQGPPQQQPQQPTLQLQQLLGAQVQAGPSSGPFSEPLQRRSWVHLGGMGQPGQGPQPQQPAGGLAAALGAYGSGQGPAPTSYHAAGPSAQRLAPLAEMPDWSMGVDQDVLVLGEDMEQDAAAFTINSTDSKMEPGSLSYLLAGNSGSGAPGQGSDQPLGPHGQPGVVTAAGAQPLQALGMVPAAPGAAGVDAASAHSSLHALAPHHQQLLQLQGKPTGAMSAPLPKLQFAGMPAPAQPQWPHAGAGAGPGQGGLLGSSPPGSSWAMPPSFAELERAGTPLAPAAGLGHSSHLAGIAPGIKEESASGAVSEPLMRLGGRPGERAWRMALPLVPRSPVVGWKMLPMFLGAAPAVCPGRIPCGCVSLSPQGPAGPCKAPLSRSTPLRTCADAAPEPCAAGLPHGASPLGGHSGAPGDRYGLLTAISLRMAHCLPDQLPPDLQQRLHDLVSSADAQTIQAMLEEQA